jgi:L-alanine-DL-glutamate epimerase-like enolase superfamily enzyme
MAIQSIDATYLEIPLPAAFHPSWVPGLVMEHNRCLVVQVHDDSGHTGIGAGTVFERKQAELGAYVAVETVGRFLTGADPFEIEKHAELIARFGLLIGGRPWPLECALWDLMAKIAGVPLYKLLGGSRDRIRLYCSFGESLLTKNVESRLAAIDARRAEGFTAFKLRSRSADYRDDARMLETVRAHVGDDVELMVDCNQGWNLSPLGVTWSFEHAREFCLAAEASGLRWVEEPRSRFDFDGLARLRSEAGVPIAGGELNQGLHEFQILRAWPAARRWRARWRPCARRARWASAPTPGPTASGCSTTFTWPAASPTATSWNTPTRRRAGSPRRATPCWSIRRGPSTACSRSPRRPVSAARSTPTRWSASARSSRPAEPERPARRRIVNVS